MTQTEADIETLHCPFPDCDESVSYDAHDEFDREMAEYHAENHYEHEHAGKVEIQVSLTKEQLLGGRDTSEIRERILEEEEFAGWEISHVRTKILEEADDHGVLTAGNEDNSGESVNE